MGLGQNIAKKADTLKMLFYYRVVIGGLHAVRKIKRALSKPYASYDFVIIDDAVPKSPAGFRNYEFSFLLKNVRNSALYSIIGYPHNIYPMVYYTIKSIEEFNTTKQRYCREDDIEPQRVHPFFRHGTKISAKLAYVVFQKNAEYLINYLEERKIPFILELYPGGGFSVAEEGPSFDNLKRILASPYLDTVIPTMVNTHKFLLEKKLCDPAKIHFIFGGILAKEFMDIAPKEMKYGVKKNTIDICFGATKYMSKGLDKGYDVFIDMAHLLLQKSDIFRFHIIGNFDETDMPIEPKYRQYFTFHGYIKNEDTIPYYKDKDIVVSPNRAFVLAKGAFDGFPTGTTAEAGLQGLCMLLTDPLKLNIIMDEGRDAIFLEPDAQQFADFIIHLAHNPDELYSIGERGKLALQKGFDYNKQLDIRLSLINKSLEGK